MWVNFPVLPVLVLLADMVTFFVAKGMTIIFFPLFLRHSVLFLPLSNKTGKRIFFE
jgi:hypothetical protein